MVSHAPAAPQTTAARPGWVLGLWALAGLCLSFVVSVLGVFLVPVGLALVVVLVVRRRASGWPAALVGAGLLPLWVAWENRAGPGEACTSTATSQSCTELFSPWPWAAVGLVLVVLGVTLVVRTGPARRDRAA
ncbi:MAG: hypothetical protein NVV70_17285 [Cellulomonas sp.]|nr:hypothetical protein [Cellulomonas sp.]MCR6649801.1 hypothetical protein [Cellulomonas sp.]